MKAWPFVLLLAASAGCGGDRPAPAPLEGWSRRGERYAEHFQVWAKGEERLVLVFGHGGPRDTVGAYHLSPDDRATAVPWNARHLHPLRRVALQSTTHAPFLSALGRSGSVAACAHLDQVRDTALLARIRAGRVQEVGTGDGIDRERLLALHVDALFLYPFGRTDHALERSGPPVVEVSEYLEEHPLGRAEWIRFFGTLFQEEAAADSLFQGIVDRYAGAMAQAPADSVRPQVFFGSAWKGEWSVPPGNSYMARLIADAKGAYLFADRSGDGNLTIAMETALMEGRKAQVWGRILAQPGTVTARDIADGDERILRLPAFTGGRCFYGNSMETDLFGAAALEPDVMLADLLGILHPAAAGGRAPVYFRLVQ